MNTLFKFIFLLSFIYINQLSFASQASKRQIIEPIYSIASCPDEILLLIFSNEILHSADKVSLYLTSKFFSKIVSPLIKDNDSTFFIDFELDEYISLFKRLARVIGGKYTMLALYIDADNLNFLHEINKTLKPSNKIICKTLVITDRPYNLRFASLKPERLIIEEEIEPSLFSNETYVAKLSSLTSISAGVLKNSAYNFQQKKIFLPPNIKNVTFWGVNLADTFFSSVLKLCNEQVAEITDNKCIYILYIKKYNHQNIQLSDDIIFSDINNNDLIKPDNDNLIDVELDITTEDVTMLFKKSIEFFREKNNDNQGCYIKLSKDSPLKAHLIFVVADYTNIDRENLEIFPGFKKLIIRNLNNGAP